jgi:hypothetical protein
MSGVESDPELVRLLLPWFMPVIVHNPRKGSLHTR